MALDPAAIRDDFPIMCRQVHGGRLVYLDSAATSHKPRPVIDAVTDYFERYNSNVHRGSYQLAVEATEALEEARARVARFIGANNRLTGRVTAVGDDDICDVEVDGQTVRALRIAPCSPGDATTLSIRPVERSNSGW